MDLVAKVVGLAQRGTAPAPDQDFRATDTGEIYRGYGDGLARAFELAVTPAVFAGLGYMIDRWLGIVPVCTIAFFLVCVAGMFARTWYAYEARMQLEDARAPWARAAVPPVVAAPTALPAPDAPATHG